MKAVEKLNDYLEHAKREGFEVRFEFLSGAGASIAQFGGKTWLFVDLAQSIPEQLESVEMAMKTAVSQPEKAPDLRRGAA